MIVRVQRVPSVFNNFLSLTDPFDRLLNNFYPQARMAEKELRMPAVNVTENKESVTVAVEVPGIPKEALKIEIKEGMLVVSGERKAPDLKENSQWLRREIRFGSFERVLSLPVNTDTEKISAKFADGILTITLPKHEEMKPKEISIR